MGKKTLTIFLHTAGWLAIYLIPYFLETGTISFHQIFSEPATPVHGLSTILLIGYAYVSHFWLVPGFYLQRKYVWYVLLVAGFLLLVIWFPNVFGGPHGDGHPPDFSRTGGPPRNGPPSPLLSKASYNIVLFLVCTFASISVRQQRQLLEAQKEKLDAELAFLKTQINPHFLFNTLNSIYALAIQKSDDTPRAIIQLSELMRYILKDADADTVALDREINYINNYVALQKRRLGHTVTFAYSPPATTGSKRIAPLILMSFVENAFKHGVNPDEDSAIAIAINTQDNQLRLDVTNNKVHSVYQSETMGIGLTNASSRLQHLYPGRHQLRIEDGEKTFSIHLILELND